MALSSPLPEWISRTRLLDLDDVGTKVCQQHSGDTASDHAREVEDAYTVKRIHGSICSHPIEMLPRVYLFCR
jgi:hypothetical protein